MSSVAGAIINSDGLAEKNKTPKLPHKQSVQRSSPRPLGPFGPPSESNGALSDPEGFPDDDVVGVRGTDRNRPRDPMAQAVPKVVDKVGEKVGEEFEKFLDQYGLPSCYQCRHMLIIQVHRGRGIVWSSVIKRTIYGQVLHCANPRSTGLQP